MAIDSSATAFLFIALVVVMALLSLRALWVHADGADQRRRSGVAVFIIILYLIVPAVLASSGRLDRYEPPPAPLILVGFLTLCTVFFAASRYGARVSASIGIAALVGFQAFRIPVEIILHRLAEEGSIPFVMTYSGRNFDILTGISAATLGLVLMRREVPKFVLLAWNILGLLLLATIVVIAILATPVPFRVFVDGPTNRLPSEFPYVWLPTFLVQLALVGHLLLFRKLRLSGGGRPRSVRHEAAMGGIPPRRE